MTFSRFWQPRAALHPAWPNSWSSSTLTPKSVCVWLISLALWSAGNYTCLGGLGAVKSLDLLTFQNKEIRLGFQFGTAPSQMVRVSPESAPAACQFEAASPKLCTIWLAANWTPNRPRSFPELKRTSVNICAWHPEGEILVVRTLQTRVFLF